MKRRDDVEKAGHKIYYEELNASINEDDLGNNVLYFPSTTETIVASNVINPFTNVVQDTMALNAMFSTNDNISSESRQILNTCNDYISNSIMMNLVTIFEDPWCEGSFINVLKNFINQSNPDLFYQMYNNMMRETRMRIDTSIYHIINDHFTKKPKMMNDYSTRIRVNPDELVPFINEINKTVAPLIADQGQRFIIDIITSNAIDTESLNEFLINKVDCCPNGKSFIRPDIKNIVVKDNAHCITYLNISLNVAITKITAISEAILCSAFHFIKTANDNVNWEAIEKRYNDKYGDRNKTLIYQMDGDGE